MKAKYYDKVMEERAETLQKFKEEYGTAFNLDAVLASYSDICLGDVVLFAKNGDLYLGHVLKVNKNSLILNTYYLHTENGLQLCDLKYRLSNNQGCWRTYWIVHKANRNNG